MEVSERRSQKSQPRGRKRVQRTGGRYCRPGCHRWVEVPEGQSPEKGRTSRGRSTGAGNCHGRRRRVIVATLSVESESGEHECWGRDLAESAMVPGAALWAGLRVLEVVSG